MWCIIRSRTAGFDADAVVTLTPVGPFATRDDAVAWLDANDYTHDPQGDSTYWRSGADRYVAAEVLPMDAPDA